MRRLARGLAVAGALVLARAPLPAQVTVNVCFDCSGKLTDAYHRPVDVTPTTLSAARRAYVIAHIQANYDDAVGAGKVKVEEGNVFATYQIIVSGGLGPPPDAEHPKQEYGNAGHPGLPALVYADAFETRDGFFGDSYLNGLATTAAHELGHKLGASHNKNDPHDKMSGALSDADLQAGTVRFNDLDKQVLQRALLLGSAEPRPSDAPEALHVLIGTSAATPTPAVDHALGVTAVFTGPPGSAFGYLTLSDQFALVGGLPPVGAFVGALSFYFDGGLNMAALLGGTVYDLLGGGGTVALSDPSPFTQGVFRTATLTFATAAGPAGLTLRVEDAAETGGFISAVPEPTPAVLVLGGLLAVLPARAVLARRRRNPRAVRA